MQRVHIVLIIIISFVLLLAVMISVSPNATIIQQVAAIILGFVASLAAVSEIVGLFERIGIPNLIPIRESRFIQIEKSPFETSVAIWGPTYSGKSWLINAFAWTIQNKYQGMYQGLHYRTTKFDESFNNQLSIAPPPTSGNVVGFRFERLRSSNNFYQSMSSFTHDIKIYDYSGEYAIDITREKSIFGESPGDDRRLSINVLLSMANADIVIIALDHTQLSYRKPDEDDAIGFRKISVTKYAELVRKLFLVLEKANPEKNRMYAVCVMKADEISGSIYLHPDAIIEAYFGSEMSDALKIPKNGIVETFTTSSFGFLPGTMDPNIEFGAPPPNAYLKIKDMTNWQPYGVEYPFFWAFELKEKTLLDKQLKSSFLGKLKLRKRLRNYISYPKAKYEID